MLEFDLRLKKRLKRSVKICFGSTTEFRNQFESVQNQYVAYPWPLAKWGLGWGLG